MKLDRRNNSPSWPRKPALVMSSRQRPSKPTDIRRYGGLLSKVVPIVKSRTEAAPISNSSSIRTRRSRATWASEPRPIRLLPSERLLLSRRCLSRRTSLDRSLTWSKRLLRRRRDPAGLPKFRRPAGTNAFLSRRKPLANRERRRSCWLLMTKAPSSTRRRARAWAAGRKNRRSVPVPSVRTTLRPTY